MRYKDKDKISILKAECPEIKFKKENPIKTTENMNKTKKIFSKILANLNKGSISLFIAKKISVSLRLKII